jgi:hypothetical protein
MNKLTFFLFITLVGFFGNNIKVEDAWMRTNASGMATALFFTVNNSGDRPDTLYKVTSDISDEIEIHESYKKGDAMGMRAVDMVIINPNSTFQFKPRSFHVMILELKKDIRAGDKADFTLHFKKAGKIKITAVSREM